MKKLRAREGKYLTSSSIHDHNSNHLNGGPTEGKSLYRYTGPGLARPSLVSRVREDEWLVKVTQQEVAQLEWNHAGYLQGRQLKVEGTLRMAKILFYSHKAVGLIGGNNAYIQIKIFIGCLLHAWPRGVGPGRGP